MMLTSDKIGAKSALPRSATPFLPRAACRARRVAADAAKQSAEQETSRRSLLAALGLLGSFTAVQRVQAATDPYEELRKITESRTGSTSLLESFNSTRDTVSSAKADRGIRERLAAEAANATKPSSSSGGGSGFRFSTASSPKPAAPVAAAPSAPKPSFSLFGSGPKPLAPKPQPPKPAAPAAAAAPKAAAAAAPAAAGSSGVLGPVIQAAGVLGLVGVGANAVTSFATSNKKGSKPRAQAAAPAAAAAPSSTGKVKAATGKVKAGTGKVQAGTGKVSATKQVTKPAAAAAAAAASSTRKVVKKVPAQAAAAAGTVKGTLKQALVNTEKPDEPTDFAVAGFLGFAAALGAFFFFGLPQPKVVTPPQSPQASDPLVELAKESARSASTSSYKSPLFKSLSETDTSADRKVISAAPAVKDEAPAAAAAAPKIELPKLQVPKVEVPEPPAVVLPPVAAPAAAPAPVEAPKAEAPKPAPAAAVAPVAVKKVEEKKAQPAAATAAKAEEQQQQQGTNPLFVALAGLGVVVGAFALVGGSNSSSTEAAGSSSAAAPTAAAAEKVEGSAAAAAAAGEGVAETVTAAASTAAASAPAQGAGSDNAAYEKAVNALFADPDTADDLYSIIQPALRNGPALAWALVSNATNAETLDGWAFQKLSKARYERVRGLLVKMGLQLPDTPKPQPTINMTTSAGATDLDPEKLRAVFEALLANPASRTLMKKLLSGAGMPFNEAAFEEQIKDATYFNLAIAPILRKMPPQKLAVLADLQDPAKLQELVRSVSNLAANTTQLEAVTAELSGDVRNTVEKIRESEGTTTTTAASR